MKKVISILLAIIIGCGTMTIGFTTTFAAESNTSSVGESSGATGTCTWTLSDDDVLTISGKGRTDSYLRSSAPWGTEIKEVIVEEGVTSIGAAAFRNCIDLTKVTLPDSLTDIGNGVFNNCTALQSIIIPKNVTHFGQFIFSYCTSLSSVEILGELNVLSSRTFQCCTKLTNVILPDSLTSIREQAFYGCVELSNLMIPDSVTSVGDEAFYGCTGLSNITIPDSVSSIGSAAFDNTAWYNNQPEGVVYAGKVAYKYKGEMPENTSVEIKDETKGITSYAFDSCTNLTSITIPDSVTEIGSYAFLDCKNLKSIIIPCNVEKINSYTFGGCSNLNSITIPESVTEIETNAFNKCENLTIYGVKHSYAETYANNNSIPFAEIKIESPVESITVLNDYTLTLQENQNGLYTLAYNPNTGEYGDYFIYFYSLDDVEILVTYKDGSTKTANLYDEIDGNYVSVYDNQSKCVWLPDTDNYLEIQFMGVETKIPVVINPSPVKSIEVVKPMNPLIENDNGYINTDSNGEEFFYYNYYVDNCTDFRTADIRINYTGGTSKMAKLGDFVDGIEISYSDDQYDNHWKLGSDNYIDVKYMDKETKMPVTIIESPVESITVNSAPARVYHINDEYHQPTDLTGLKFTVKYKDGKSKIYTDNDVNNNKIGDYYFSVKFKEDKKIGANTVVLKYMGFETEYEVTVLDDIISSIEVVKFPENAVCWKYYSPDWRGAELKFNYVDGTSKTITLDDSNIKYSDYTGLGKYGNPYVYFELDDYKCRICSYLNFSDAYDKRFIIEYMGKKFEIEGLNYYEDETVSKAEIENFSMSAENMIINLTKKSGSKEQIVLNNIIDNHISKDGNRTVRALTEKGVIDLCIIKPGDTYYEGIAVIMFFDYARVSVPQSSILSYAKTTGDPNGDGYVDVLDAVEVQKYAAEQTTMTDEQKELADVNKDGFVDVLDALEIQKYAAGTITEFTKAA